jgi:hypothetical protein
VDVDDEVKVTEDWAEEVVNGEEEEESEVDGKLLVNREVVEFPEELLVEAVDVDFCWFPKARYPAATAATIIMITTSTARPLEMACVLFTINSAILSRIFSKFKP